MQTTLRSSIIATHEIDMEFVFVRILIYFFLLNANIIALQVTLSSFPFEIDCDTNANNIPNPAADDVSHVI